MDSERRSGSKPAERRARRLRQAAGAAQRAERGAAAGAQPARRGALLGGALTAPLGKRLAGRDVALDVVDVAHGTHCAPIIGWNESRTESETRILDCECPTSDLPNT